MTVDEAVKKVCDELEAMPTELFAALIKQHEDGELSRLLQAAWKEHDERNPMTDPTTVTVTEPFDPELGPIKPPPTPWNKLSVGKKIAALAMMLFAIGSAVYVAMWGRWHHLKEFFMWVAAKPKSTFLSDTWKAVWDWVRGKFV